MFAIVYLNRVWGPFTTLEEARTKLDACGFKKSTILNPAFEEIWIKGGVIAGIGTLRIDYIA